MRCWIYKTNLGTYNALCAEERMTPQILEETEDKVYVVMTANMANTWSMIGYWFEF